MQQKERREKLRELWLERPEHKRTSNELLIFYGWLERNWPELLMSGEGDPYEHLRADLTGLWVNR